MQCISFHFTSVKGKKEATRERRKKEKKSEEEDAEYLLGQKKEKEQEEKIKVCAPQNDMICSRFEQVINKLSNAKGWFCEQRAKIRGAID